METCKQQSEIEMRNLPGVTVMGVRVGVANYFLDQSIGIDGTNTFQLKLGIDETNTFQLNFSYLACKLWASQVFACGRGKLFFESIDR